MRLSRHELTRRQQVFETLQKCTASQVQRGSFYDVCRQRYLFGGTPYVSNRVNKIRPIVDRKSAFLYAPDNVKFWVEIPPDEDFDTYYYWLSPIADAVGDWWWETEIDRLFGLGVTWSLVYGSMILCVQPEPCPNDEVDIVGHLVHPRNFGVMVPDQPDLSKQEAFCLTTYFPWDQCVRRLALHPKRDLILSRLDAENPSIGSGDGKILMGPGATNYKAEYGYAGSYGYTSEYTTQNYKWHNLYIYDDKSNDYQVFTISGTEIVHDLPIGETGLPGCPPFVKICPTEMFDYFWGISLVETLSPTQEWFSGRFQQLDELVAKVLNPPKAAFGLGQSMEEKMAALGRPRGRAAFPNQNAKIQEFLPQVPSEIFNFFTEVDGFFNDLSGMRPSLWGKQESGTRTEGMAASLLRLGGAEVKRESQSIEKQAEDAADLILKMQRRYNDEPLIDERGNPFLLSSFPQKFRVRVDGHSHSPLFIEDHIDKANLLRKFGDITPERYVEMIHPSLEGSIKHDQRKIQYIKMLGDEFSKRLQQFKRGGGKTDSLPDSIE